MCPLTGDSLATAPAHATRSNQRVPTCLSAPTCPATGPCSSPASSAPLWSTSWSWPPWPSCAGAWCRCWGGVSRAPWLPKGGSCSWGSRRARRAGAPGGRPSSSWVSPGAGPRGSRPHPHPTTAPVGLLTQALPCKCEPKFTEVEEQGYKPLDVSPLCFGVWGNGEKSTWPEARRSRYVPQWQLCDCWPNHSWPTA